MPLTVDRISQRLSIRPKGVASIAVQLLDADSPVPAALANVRVRIERLSDTGKPDLLLFSGRANKSGDVRFHLGLPKEVADQPRPALPKIKVTVLDIDGDPLPAETFQLQANTPAYPVKMKTAPLKEKLAGPLDKWSAALSRALPAAVAALLQQRKITSLAALRTEKGLLDSRGLSASDKEEIRLLQAHAGLQLISRDNKVNQAIVKAGFRDIVDIARQPRSAFVGKVKGEIAEDTAARLHVVARQRLQMLGNLQTEQQARRANGMAALSYGGTAATPPCACDCGSAVSPQAYLVDLLDYAVDNLRFSAGPVSLSKLEETFGQPFAALPVECAFADRLVRQVRLCVELLYRRHSVLASDAARATAVEGALSAHAARSYDALLRALGTSYRELRLVRADADAGERLGQRLGVAAGDLDRFRLETGSTDADRQLHENQLERLFGLQGTAREPLSTGARFKDDHRQLVRWQLTGVEWRKNTDALGRIHVSIVKRASGMHEIILFKAQGRGTSSRLAIGSSRDASGEVELTAENNSGLTGRVGFRYVANDTDLHLAVVPEWAVCRRQQLRLLWRQIDYPAAAFADVKVDPDVVAETDLMRPFSRNPAHVLWTARRQVLQGWRDTFAAMPAIVDMLKDVFSASIDLPSWDAIAQRLRSPQASDRDAGAIALRALDPDVSQEAFAFLLELWHREDAAREITPQEREQTLDVLVNIRKARQRTNWRTEEAGISVSMPFFLLSNDEPVLNPLRAPSSLRAAWRAELERNSAAPLIDPDVVAEANFNAASASAAAYDRWSARRALLGDGRPAGDAGPPASVTGTAFQAVATVNTLAKLDAALSSGNLPASGAPLFHAIGFNASDLNAIDDALTQGRTLPVRPEQYGLSAAELRMLFEVRRLGANADPGDWDHVHHILLQAEKRRHLYPQWRAEEAADALSLNPDTFHVPLDLFADALPAPRLTAGFVQWRRDEQRRRAWRTQLQARIDQDKAVEAEIQAAVDAAEEASLPVLRDDLAMATVSAATGGDTLDERRRWIMNNLLVNAFENGCRKTTRVAQGIETVQLLLWGVHSKQFEDTRYALEVAAAETFAEEWRWLGSYATWRSAMFIYLYPENLLLPELRQGTEYDAEFETNPTRLYRAILATISGQAAPAVEEAEAANARQEGDPLVQVWIDRIFRAIGGANPASNEAQTIIFRELSNWRTSNAIIGGDDDSDMIFDRTQVFHRIHPTETNALWWTYVPQQPNLAANPFLVEWRDDFVRASFEEYLHTHSISNPPPLDKVACWAEYLTESAFLEDHLYVPLAFALDNARRGDFESALMWFAVVYDFRKTPAANLQGWASQRLELYFAQQSASASSTYQALDEWLDDALNPHRIAATRKGADARFVVLSTVRCLLEYADGEFARDTSESLSRTRELYETARRLLYSDALGKDTPDCASLIGTLISEIGEGEWVEIAISALDRLDVPSIDPDQLGGAARDSLLDQLKAATRPTNPPRTRSRIRQDVHDVMARHFAAKPAKALDKVRSRGADAAAISYRGMLDDTDHFAKVQGAGSNKSTDASWLMLAGGGLLKPVKPQGRWVPAPNEFRFCIPRNPLIAMLRLRYEVSWFKLNNCMNFAGQHRDVPTYAAPTDTYSGLPVPGFGVAAMPALAALRMPTNYRYRGLIERAKQLLALAQQMEGTYLSFLEKRDHEAYTILRARQDLAMADANVALQDLRVAEAVNGMALTDVQLERAGATLQHYQRLIEDDLSGYEAAAVSLLIVSGLLQGAVALAATGGAVVAGLTAGGMIGAESGPGALFTALGGGGGALAATMSLSQTAFSATTGALGTGSAVFSMLASFERRKQEWQFQSNLADIDVQIAVAQQVLAENRHQIARQEKRLSELGADNASDVVTFLNTKFTNAELYAWMGGVVGGIYRYVLQEATTVARLSQRQLAFERQVADIAIILDDYWTYTDTSAIGGAAPDRRGLTGSARLLQDLTRLDQEAFLTDRRKLQLTKTFSLALHDPVSFARFRETGELVFSTSHADFDRDFPGHYLRLIKRVRVSVIALVPPTEGIRATLSSSGPSSVVRGPDTFVVTEVRRDPETIAFTSPINASGLFELQEQPEMLLPFEGNGVASRWTFSMPRAANAVDYSTIADILITLEYTALNSEVYRNQVIQRLDETVSRERPFSFRHQFADCWYDLNNPNLLPDDQQMRVTFETRRSDFPPNLSDLRIEHVSLYFVRQDGFSDTIAVEALSFAEASRSGSAGGAASTGNGLISTREANGGSWTALQGKSPVGSWELRLPKSDVAKAWFSDEKINDILFVITFAGTTPGWPGADPGVSV